MKTKPAPAKANRIIPTTTLDAATHHRINQQAFFRLGRQALAASDISKPAVIRSALFSQYRDLDALRYDFPLILCATESSSDWVVSLTDAIDDYVANYIAPGAQGEHHRQILLSIEPKMKKRLSCTKEATFSEIWKCATTDLIKGQSPENASETERFLASAFRQMNVDGPLLNCDDQFTKELFLHNWRRHQHTTAKSLYSRILTLETKLSDILRIKYLSSADARSANKLSGFVGSGDKDEFDFQAMANILKTAPVGDELPSMREDRIRKTIKILQAQKFVEPNGLCASSNFVFESVAEAVDVYADRLAAMKSLVAAMSIAELEINNRYNEELHERVFSNLHTFHLSVEDQASFPSYLVYVTDADSPECKSTLLDIFQRGLPFKVVALNHSIVGNKGQQLARIAMSLNNVFTFQGSASALYSMRDDIAQGMQRRSTALFNIYSGQTSTAEQTSSEKTDLAKTDLTKTKANDNNADVTLPNYLLAAAAADSRVFPSLVFDPENGSTMKYRFQLTANASVQDDWVTHNIEYEDENRSSGSVANSFTVIDFIANLPQFREHFSCIPKSDWIDSMMPAEEFLTLKPIEQRAKVPYILVVDNDNCLHRAIVDSHLIDTTVQCLDLWHQLQEQGGIHNSHVEAALKRQPFNSTPEQQIIDETKIDNNDLVNADERKPPKEQTGETINNALAPSQGKTNKSLVPKPPSNGTSDPGQAWIDSIRCTTCNECTTLNGRMFAYDDNQRAFIKDPTAGSFKELVEAAESCQVAIIHPGRPIDEAESGIAELVERAKQFQ